MRRKKKQQATRDKNSAPKFWAFENNSKNYQSKPFPTYGEAAQFCYDLNEAWREEHDEEEEGIPPVEWGVHTDQFRRDQLARKRRDSLEAALALKDRPLPGGSYDFAVRGEGNDTVAFTATYQESSEDADRSDDDDDDEEEDYPSTRVSFDDDFARSDFRPHDAIVRGRLTTKQVEAIGRVMAWCVEAGKRAGKAGIQKELRDLIDAQWAEN